MRRAVLERTGARVTWRSRAIDDARVGAEIRALLAKPLTAESAVEIALVNNRDLQAAFEGVGLALADVAEATVLRNPEVEADLRVPVDGDGSAVEILAIQDVVSLLTLPGRRDAARAALASARARAAAAAIDLAAAVRATFYDVQAATQLVELRRTVRDSQAAQLDLVERLRRAGNVPQLALSQQRALLDEARLALARAETSLATARPRLDALLGLGGADTTWTVAGPLREVPDEPVDVSHLERDAVARSLALEGDRGAIRAAAARVGVARLESWLPRLGPGVSAQKEVGGEWTVGPALALEIPLFDRNQGGRTRAHAELRRARHRYTAAAVGLRARARRAAVELGGARARVIFVRDQLVPERQRVLEETLRQYNAMNASHFELLAAQRQQVAAAAEYVQSLHDYWHARARVEQILAGSDSASSAAMGGEQ